jgi:peptidoglycan L-alanyl-D-glutamate endopeptidase CwlK
MSKMLFPTYPHVYGNASRRELHGVMPAIVQVAKLTIVLCEYDGRILPGGGLRTDAQAADNVARGTGILNSLHKRQPDGWGHAVDIVPLVDSDGDGARDDVSWETKYLPAFKAMAIAAKRASAILWTPIRQGCDWNMNGVLGEPGTKEWDWPHLENPIPFHLKKAESEMLRYREELSALGYDLRPENYPIPA